MTYRLDISRKAGREIFHCFHRMRRHSFASAEKYRIALEDAINIYLLNEPIPFGWYWETGAPNRAFLYTISPHTAYWVIFRVYEEEGVVRIIAFLSASAEPGTHGL